MKVFTKLAFILVSAAAMASAEAAELQFTEVELIPTARLRWGDTAFIAPQHFRDLDIQPGQQAILRSGDYGSEVPVYLLPINREPESISMRRTLRDALNVEAGTATVTLRLATPDETGLDDLEIDTTIRTHPGDTTRWPGIVLGGPHADSDRFTGEIVELASEMASIPAVTGWRGRISFIGRWLDTNRPMQREPRELFRIRPDRSWTDAAEALYHSYREGLIQVGTSNRRPTGNPPIDLYVDFHGHGLTVTNEEGERIHRYVVEAMARGYTLEEVELLKSFLDEALLEEFGDEAPPSYWGNIPADRVYTVAGVETTFRYAGLGGRVYGALNPEIAHRSIHLEFPSPIRTTVEHRPRSARVLVQFMSSVRDHFHQDGFDWVDAPGGEFPFGGGTGMEALGGEPTLTVSLSPFQIARTPVTNRQYATFVNESLRNGTAVLQMSTVMCAETDTPWFYPGPIAPYSGIVVSGEGTLMTIAQLIDHPVVNVTHYGATAFASHHGARLPTEAEWEYVAKWDPVSNSSVYWREADDPEHLNLPAGNYMHSPQRQAGFVVGATTPVGSFRDAKSPIGALDMAGNVWEWTADWFANLPEDDTLTNPRGAEEGTMKVTRGGSWDTEPMTVQATYRMSKAPHAALPTLGFRIVREVGE